MLTNEDRFYLKLREFIPPMKWLEEKPEEGSFIYKIATAMDEYEYERLCKLQKTSEPIGRLEVELKRIEDEE